MADDVPVWAYGNSNNSLDDDSILGLEAFLGVVPDPPSPIDSLPSPTSTPSPVMTQDLEDDPEVLLSFKCSFYAPDPTTELGWVKRKGRADKISCSINFDNPADLQARCIEECQIDGISATHEMKGIPEALLKSEVVWSVWVLGSEKFYKGRAMRVFFPPGPYDRNARRYLKEFLMEAHRLWGRLGGGAGIEFHSRLEQHKELVQS